jgi:hypothetical protein
MARARSGEHERGHEALPEAGVKAVRKYAAYDDWELGRKEKAR